MQSTDTSPRAWLSYAEAARYLGMSERQLRRAVAARRVEHTKLGRNVQFSTAQLDAFVETSTIRVES